MVRRANELSDRFGMNLDLEIADVNIILSALGQAPYIQVVKHWWSSMDRSVNDV